LTVRIFRGEAERWTGIPRVLVAQPGRFEDGTTYEVESDRAYRDRLVLKLATIDDATTAAGLRGLHVAVREDLAPPPPDGSHHPEALIGLEVFDVATDRRIGRVEEVMPTAGADLLVVVAETGGVSTDRQEILVPLAEEIVVEIDLDRRRVRIRPPAGLLDLNQERKR
jgi:16S rRNA processing protein RimM